MALLCLGCAIVLGIIIKVGKKETIKNGTYEDMNFIFAWGWIGIIAALIAAVMI